ncbi:MAG: beta-ketoacyl-ACP synthase II [Proteobacteria bacterium]|jgi:3-oxoacyl-[acyl-carrier-protein] synthase II|nr:beta-ketoacyl-ACP synthase II [Pseudomonadota bacterium]
MRRVVITGIGLVTPLGCGRERFWSSLEQGVSGVDRITKFDASKHDCKIAAEVKDFDPLEYGMNKKQVRRLDFFSQYALASAHQAIEDAKLPLKDKNPNIGVIVGSGVGGISTIEDEKERFYLREKKGKNGASFVSPFFVPMIMPNAAAGNISMKYKLNNASMSTASACATGLHSIIYAAKDIMLGDCDVMIAGGTEGGITPLGVGCFANMNAICKDCNDEPQKASRPFDRERKGFVMGEGAGIVLLESLEYALKRGARIYAEIAGYGLTSDAHHITAPDPDSYEIARAIKLALDRAGISHEEVDYINAHGTSTPDNDLSETNGIKKVFGDSAYKVKISSTKSMMGHIIGGAGAIETLVCLFAMERSIVPPTINYENPDPQCDLYYVPNKAEHCEVNIAMNNSFGFGGHNAVLLLKRYENGQG